MKKIISPGLIRFVRRFCGGTGKCKSNGITFSQYRGQFCQSANTNSNWKKKSLSPDPGCYPKANREDR